MRAAALMVLFLPALSAQVTVAGRVFDENGAAVAGARVELRNPALVPPSVAAASDAQGRFRLELGRAGEYTIHAERPGFFVLDKVLVLLREGPNEVTVTLNHLREFVESLDVVYSPPAIDLAETSDQKQLNNLEILEIPYPASQDFRSALPMFSGVVQDTGGRLHFNGGASDQTNFALDGFNISDPATGLLEARLNIDAVRSMDLETSRFSAGKGRGSAGALDIRTGMGDDRFRFGVTNFVPSFSTARGLVLSKWTPRITVSGPLVRGRAWFHNGFDTFYDVDTVRELPRGQDRNRSLTSSNLSRLQVNLTPSNILTGSYLLNYMDTNHYGLSFLDPVETTVHRRGGLHVATVKDQVYLKRGALIEIGFAATRGLNRGSPQGANTYVVSPQGRSGNYFADLSRHTHREQGTASFLLPTIAARGSHQLTLGVDLQRSGFDQTALRHDYLVRRSDGALARQVSFSGAGAPRKTNLESAFYAQDRWAPREGLILELGLRADRDQIVRDTLILPRFSAAWSPKWMKQTKISAGFGIFNDTLSLETLTRQQDQVSLSTFYSRAGSPARGPVETGFLVDSRSLETPRARLYSLSLERMLPGGFYGKASYVRRVGWKGLTFVEPEAGLLVDRVLYSLRNQRGDRYDALELGARRTFAGQFEWVAGYTYSRARSNAVVEYKLEDPTFAPQSPGPMEWDTPHRFLTWGWAPAPHGHGPKILRPLFRELSLAYLVEARSGFPFSVVNEEGFMVGKPNQRRFPYYFNVNLHFEKKFRFFHYLWAWRFGLNNLTNHGNPNVVNNNIDSLFFLAYERGQRRAWNVRLRFLGRK